MVEKEIHPDGAFDVSSTDGLRVVGDAPSTVNRTVTFRNISV